MVARLSRCIHRIQTRKWNALLHLRHDPTFHALLLWTFFEHGVQQCSRNQNSAIVIDQDEQYRRGFFLERFRRGWEFGRVRADFERWGILRRGIGIACMPVAILSTLLKTGRECLRAGRFGDFVATLPFQVAANAAWCAGEAIGYAVTTNIARGGSTRPAAKRMRSARP